MKVYHKRYDGRGGYDVTDGELPSQSCGYCGKKVPTRKVRCRRAFCNITCRSEWQRSQKPVTEKWLRQKYIAEKLSAVDIAKLVDRDPKTVWFWLKDFKIPTRPRGHAYKTNLLAWYYAGEPSPFKGRKHSRKTRKLIREARLRDGGVPYLKDGVHWLKGKGGEDHPNWKGGITPERQAFYSSPEWQRVARKVKKRDNRTCQKCKKCKADYPDLPFDIHHIVSFECVELRAVLSNLIYLCERCHYWTHSKKNVKGRFIKETPLRVPSWLQPIK